MKKQIKMSLEVKFFLLFLAIALLTTWVGAMVNAEDFVFKQNSQIDFRVACYNQGDYCSPATNCYLTMFYPNSSVMVDNELMSNDGAYHSYNLPDSSILGSYTTSIVCDDSGESSYANPSMLITPDGSPTSQAKTTSFSVLTIIFLILTIGFILMGVFSKNLPLLIIGLMFGSTLFLFTLQLLMINPDLIANLSFYASIVTFYKIYIWIYFAIILFLIIVFIYNLVQWDKMNKQAKMKEKYGEGIFE